MDNLFNETVELQRMSSDSTGKSYQTHISSLNCMIQPYDKEKTEGVENTFGQDYKMYCPDTDIVEGDRIIRDGSKYSVIGVEEYSGRDELDHLKVIIRM